jgi:O-methyltransferase
MKLSLKLLRKTKALFIKLKFYKFLEPFSGIFLNLAYLSKLSKWANKTEMPAFNDFYSKNHNYQNRYMLYKHVIESENLSKICYLEFGVSHGHSFTWWLENNQNKNSQFYGFDTFTGLPEDWGFFKKGDMNAKVPNVEDQRGEFVPGLFQDTLPTFLQDFKCDSRKVIHLDADLYSSTLYVLTMLANFLRKDDIIIFDEFNIPMHEFKAFTEFTQAYYLKTTVIGAVNNYYQVAFRIIE